MHGTTYYKAPYRNSNPPSSPNQNQILTSTLKPSFNPQPGPGSGESQLKNLTFQKEC